MHSHSMIDTELRMTYLGDGISTDEDFEEEAGDEGGSYTPTPSEEEAPESDDPLSNPDEAQ